MLTRRKLLQTAGLSALAPGLVGTLATRMQLAENQLNTMTEGRINHSVCRWCFQDTPLELLCEVGKKMGLKAIDLVAPNEFEVLKKFGMHGSMVSPTGLKDYLKRGWNDPLLHGELLAFYENLIPMAAKAGFTNVIVFSGNRNGIDDERGLEACRIGLQKLLQTAENEGVTLMMELLNSKVDHADYQCDRTSWGVDLCKRIGSDQFKLLYDIYHMQIMEGNVIQTIRENHQFIGHYHTAGVPGRHEIDDSQELFYPAIMRAIVETKFEGFVAQEFMPTHKDKMESLRQAIQICDI